ncbi:MAG: 30S ribosomal protein S9 [Puniceicoccales bacterium]|jgi:small subunit ribosomal protein S9|nr:30S ribosomal protein S9 [Puniceicoccales bacterium]
MARGEKDKNIAVFCGTGRRKCAVASVVICSGTGKFDVNGRALAEFCSLDDAERRLLAPLVAAGKIDSVDVAAKTSGGGISGQIGAISLGLARSLEKMDPDLRAPLKKEGLLTRDSRIRERKKPGRPGARKRFQFSKR